MDDGGFVLAADGWAQVCPLGEFWHAGAGVTQVVDAEACAAMATDFVGRAAEPNFPGALVDFDHFSMDAGKPSEAAGWVGALEARDDGLWAKIRWTDAGLAAVTGGRYRLVSPVFPEPSACEDLGGGRIRPRRLVSVALTNEPNIKGGRPIANRCPESGAGEQGSGFSVQVGNEQRPPMENRGGVKRYRWTLGPEAEGGHCPTCLERSGQVKTARAWARMPGTLCGRHCRCTLEEVGAAAGTANRWSDEARKASLAVRRAKAEARAGQTEGDGSSSGSGRDKGTLQQKTQEQTKGVPAVKKGDTEGSIKARYTRLRAELEAAEGDGEKLREASKHYLDSRYRDGTDFTLADIEAVRECLMRDKTLTDYQIRAAEDAITEASAWVRGDSRGLLDMAEEEIAGKLIAAGIRFAEVEALRRVLNPARYYAEYGVEAFPSGLPDWIDDFAASEELQSQYPFLRPGETRQTPTFGPTTYDKALIKQGMMTRKALTESLKRRADAAARQDAVMPILKKTKAGGWTRGSVNVDAAGVMYDLPADMRAGTFGNSGKTMRIPVETRATNVRVIPTRGTRVGAGSVAAAVVPLAIDALMRTVPAARRTEARNYLRTASEVGKLSKKPGIDAVLSTGARLFFGDIEGAKRGERFGDPIGKYADEKEMAERYGRGSGTENRWSDAARAASLAVRKAKGATRAVGKVGSGGGGGSGSDSKKTVAGSQKKTGYGKQVTTMHGMPQKFLPPTGPATQALVEWVNVKTGERWTAPSGGYTPPNEDWVPVTGGAAATIRKPGPPAATRVVRGQPPPVIRSPRSVKAPHG
jgi:hypothetical protein